MSELEKVFTNTNPLSSNKPCNEDKSVRRNKTTIGDILLLIKTGKLSIYDEHIEMNEHAEVAADLEDAINSAKVFFYRVPENLELHRMDCIQYKKNNKDWYVITENKPDPSDTYFQDKFGVIIVQSNNILLDIASIRQVQKKVIECAASVLSEIERVVEPEPIAKPVRVKRRAFDQPLLDYVGENPGVAISEARDAVGVKAKSMSGLCIRLIKEEKLYVKVVSPQNRFLWLWPGPKIEEKKIEITEGSVPQPLEKRSLQSAEVREQEVEKPVVVQIIGFQPEYEIIDFESTGETNHIDSVERPKTELENRVFPTIASLQNMLEELGEERIEYSRKMQKIDDKIFKIKNALRSMTELSKVL